MQRGKQMTAVELLVRLAVVKTNLPDQSRSAQLESGVRRKAHAPFGAGERLRNPTYRHPGCDPGSAGGYVMKKPQPTTPDPKASRTWERLEEFARAHVQHFIQALLELNFCKFRRVADAP